MFTCREIQLQRLAVCLNLPIFSVIIMFMDKLPGGVAMSTISKQEVEHVAHLARLNLTEEEKEQFTKQLDSILNFAQKLNELDTENVEPTSHVLPLVNVMRDDVPHESLPVEEALQNTAEHQDGQVKVPSVLEE